MAATCPVVEGFEHGVTANGTGGNVYPTVNAGGTLSIVASRRGAGARALERAASASGGSFQINLPSSSVVVVGVFYVYFTTLSLGATNRQIYNLRNGGNNIAFLGVILTGGSHKFRMTAGAATQDSAAISLNTMYRIDYRATLNDGADTIVVDWSINGAAQTQASGSTVQTTITNLLFGNCTNLGGGETMTCEWDDMALSTTSGDYPIGDIEVVSLAPTNIDLANSNTPTDFQTDGGIDPVAGDFAKLDDAPLTASLTDWIAQDVTGTGKFLQLDIANPVGTPLGVGVSAAVTNDASATCRYEYRSRQSDATEVATQVTINPTTAGAYLRHFIPPPSGGWTNQKLADLVLRFGYSNDVTPLPRFSAFTVSYARAPLLPTGTGQVTAPAGVLAGTGTVKVVGTGAATAPAALLAGTGTVKVTGQGALTAPAALLAGAGTVVSPITGQGALTAPAALVAGQGDVDVAGTGSLTTPAGLLAGQGTVAWPAISGVGALLAPAGLVSGAGKAIVTAAGQLVASAGQLLGSMEPLPVGVNVRFRHRAEGVRMRTKAEGVRMRLSARGDGIKVRP